MPSKIKMEFTMDDTNVEWLYQKSPINHPFKGFSPIDILFPQLTSPIHIFRLNSLKKHVS
jgi:hypothetical protein